MYLARYGDKPFLVRGEGYDEFIPLFTTALNAKPETVIRKHKGRSSIEQTIKELKSNLEIEGSYNTKKESNYGHILCSFWSIISSSTCEFISLI